MGAGSQDALILDANVLIDYCDSDTSILALASEQRRVYVAGPVLDEVDGFDEDECERLGLRVLQPTTEQSIEAGRGSSALSFQDKLCLAMAEENDLTAVTNDRRLRAECDTRGIRAMWGLGIMVDLVVADRLGASDAIAVAEAMHVANPHFITAAILETFREKLSQDSEDTGDPRSEPSR